MNERIVMTKFADYHGTFAENAPDTVEIINGTEAATVRTMMANGELEISDQWQTYDAYQSLGPAGRGPAGVLCRRPGALPHDEHQDRSPGRRPRAQGPWLT